MKISEAKLTPGTLHIPETIGGVVVAYNIPEIPNSGLKLDGDTLAKIYLGEITKWNDESIAKNNPDQNLPDEKIVPVRRSDGSGTTFGISGMLYATTTPPMVSGMCNVPGVSLASDIFKGAYRLCDMLLYAATAADGLIV